MQDKKQKISVADFSLTNLSDDYYEDPYPYYHALREQSPVHRFADGSYFFTRHADLFRIYRDPKLFSSDKKKMFKPCSAIPYYMSTIRPAWYSTTRRCTPMYARLSAMPCRKRPSLPWNRACAGLPRGYWTGLKTRESST